MYYNQDSATEKEKEILQEAINKYNQKLNPSKGN